MGDSERYCRERLRQRVDELIRQLSQQTSLDAQETRKKILFALLTPRLGLDLPARALMRGKFPENVQDTLVFEAFQELENTVLRGNISTLRSGSATAWAIAVVTNQVKKRMTLHNRYRMMYVSDRVFDNFPARNVPGQDDSSSTGDGGSGAGIGSGGDEFGALPEEVDAIIESVYALRGSERIRTAGSQLLHVYQLPPIVTPDSREEREWLISHIRGELPHIVSSLEEASVRFQSQRVHKYQQLWVNFTCQQAQQLTCVPAGVVRLIVMAACAPRPLPDRNKRNKIMQEVLEWCDKPGWGEVAKLLLQAWWGEYFTQAKPGVVDFPTAVELVSRFRVPMLEHCHTPRMVDEVLSRWL